MSSGSSEKLTVQEANLAAEARIEAVIFDYGNVVSLPQQPSEVERMASLLGMPLDRFCERYWRFRLSYDRAELTGESYWASVIDGHESGLDHDQLARLMALDGESWAHPNEKTLGWAKQLKREGHRVPILSNMPLPVSEYIAENCDWLEIFEQRIFSCSVGFAKPDPRIYRHCLSALQLRPEQTLFVDDRPENVRAASELGMHSMIFETLEQTSVRAGGKFHLPVPVT
jgi:putative hydrolase of the HAD superfamily